jgi:hypothetical protein
MQEITFVYALYQKRTTHFPWLFKKMTHPNQSGGGMFFIVAANSKVFCKRGSFSGLKKI